MSVPKYKCLYCQAEFKSQILLDGKNLVEEVLIHGICCPACGLRVKISPLENIDYIRILEDLEKNATDEYLRKLEISRISLENSIASLKTKWPHEDVCKN